jgi:hypothetical protein
VAQKPYQTARLLRRAVLRSEGGQVRSKQKLKGKLAERLLGQYFCNDCNVDVVKIGDWYMAASKVWEKELGLGWTDNLCIECLTKRLGREPVFFTDIFLASAGGVALSAKAAKELVPLSARMMQTIQKCGAVSLST